MKQWILISKTVLILGLLGLAACAAMGGVVNEETEPAASLPFTGIIWQLNNFTLNGKTINLVPNSLTTIEFTDDGQLSGTGGCNHYFGSYTFNQSSGLLISQVGMTEMACPDTMEQETNFLQALQQLTQLQRDALGLTLLSQDGQTVLNFTEQVIELVVTLSIEQLFNQTWQLDSYINQDVAAHLASSNVTLVFDGQGGFSGHGGCNSYFGTYSLSDNNGLALGAIGSTKMYCEESIGLETEYLGLLSQMASFVLDANGLHLASPDGQLKLDFVANGG